MFKLIIVDFLVVLGLGYFTSNSAIVSDVNCNRVVECGVRQWSEDDPMDRIINGKIVTPGKWPWVVALFAGGKFKCTASLVSNKYVLTAGHCIRKNDTFEIVAGVLDHTSQKRIRLNTKRVVRHPGYVDLGLFANNDIVIIELAKPLNFTRFVWPICLAKQLHETKQDKAYISGWGRIKWTKPNATIP
uniref:Peptidase S1 domain-containing protein n=1 Tax=Ditylenchus dipsaci TaxID=166011 RepID=A0A915CZR1_9BILA